MTDIVTLAPVLRSPPQQTHKPTSCYLAYIQETLAEFASRTLDLMGAVDVTVHLDEQAEIYEAIFGLGPFLRAARGMARTAQDGLMLAALDRALAYLDCAREAHTSADLRAALGLLRGALASALAECEPDLWVAAEPLFAGISDAPSASGVADGQGGAA